MVGLSVSVPREVKGYARARATRTLQMFIWRRARARTPRISLLSGPLLLRKGGSFRTALQTTSFSLPVGEAGLLLLFIAELCFVRVADIPDQIDKDEGTNSRRPKHQDDVFALVKEYISSSELRQPPLLVLVPENRQRFTLTTSRR